jgi:hypothetical protein
MPMPLFSRLKHHSSALDGTVLPLGLPGQGQECGLGPQMFLSPAVMGNQEDSTVHRKTGWSGQGGVGLRARGSLP